MEKEKRAYKTRQSALVLGALQALGGGHNTAESVARLLKNRGQDIGTATVYRQLDRLVQGGQVLRYTLPGSVSACYQLQAEGHGQKPHCHTICVRCGDVAHLDCDEVEDLARHIALHHSFEVDMMNTVFYGTCDGCRRQDSRKE